MRTVRIWDLPTRLFHWLLATAVIGLVVSGNIGGNAMVWHGRLGYLVGALLLFRIIWGFVGGRWSRFGQFVRGPLTVLRYLRGRDLSVEDSAGHNPLGALSVLGLLGLLALQVSTGFVSDDEIAFTGPLVNLVSGDAVSLATRVHRLTGEYLLLVLVGLHLGAIAFYRIVRKKDLIGPMWHGDKQLPDDLPPSVDNRATRIRALVILVVSAAVVAGVVSLGG